MILINSKKEEEIRSIENKHDDWNKAREILESALCQQFGMLTLGLYSFSILQGNDVSLDDIDMINTVLKDNGFLKKDIENSYILEFVASGIYEKKWKTIRLQDLLETKIRLIGKTVFIWEIEEINEQLAILGSDYRFFLAGGIQMMAENIKKNLNLSTDCNSIDFRYIFGKVDYITVTDGGMLFNYIYEYVHSPFFEDGVPGFSMEYTAVVRDCIIKKMNGTDFEQIKDHILIHEILHTISYSFRLGSPFTSANWNLYVSRDICRFLRQSRTVAEINEVFRLYKENVFEKLFGKYTDNYEKIK